MPSNPRIFKLRRILRILRSRGPSEFSTSDDDAAKTGSKDSQNDQENLGILKNASDSRVSQDVRKS